MPFYFDCTEKQAESAAQIAALRELRLAVIGSVGEAAALGAHIDEEIRVTSTQYDSDRGEVVFRDFDVLALIPLERSWELGNPAAIEPHPLDRSIHARLSGGIRAEVEWLLGGPDPLPQKIKGLPQNAYDLVERRTADGHLLFTPVLGVLRAIRLGFAHSDYGVDPRQIEPTAEFFRRFEAAAIPPGELLDDVATGVIASRITWGTVPIN